jgi:hypothetical protein
MQLRAARIVASAPKIPLLGALIRSGVGLTGVLLALVGYQSTLAMLGGAAVATLAWIVLHCGKGRLDEPCIDDDRLELDG